MKFYKSRLQSRVAPNDYLINHEKYQHVKNQITLYHCRLKDKIAVIEPSSWSVTKEELKWNYIECAELECNDIKFAMY